MASPPSTAPARPEPFQLPVRVRAGLDLLRGRARSALTLRGLAALLGLVLAMALVSFALDRVLRLSWNVRALLLVGQLVAAYLIVARRLLAPLSRVMDDVELARLVEREHPELESRLISAVQFARPEWTPSAEASRELAGWVVHDAGELAAKVEFGKPVQGAPMARHGSAAALALFCGAGLCAGFPATAGTWFQRNVLLSNSARWPQDTRLSLETAPPLGEDGRVKVPRGEDLTLTVQAEGVIPSRVYLISEGPTGYDRYTLDALGEGRFRMTLSQVSESFDFYLRGGDDRLPGGLESDAMYRAEVIRRPWIEDLTVRVQPPPYTGLPPREFGIEAGSVELPVDTQVELTVTISKRLKSATMRGQSRPDPADPDAEAIAPIYTAVRSGDRVFRVDFVLGPRDEGVFEIEVVDEDGLGFERPAKFSLVAKPDGAPECGLLLQGIGLNVTPQATLGFLAQLGDDYGLTKGRLFLQATGGGSVDQEPPPPVDKSYSFPELEGRQEVEVQDELELSELGLVPKQSVTLYVEADDNDPRGPNTGRSPNQLLRVVTPDELLTDLLRRMHEARLELERMIEEEEKLAAGLRTDDETTLERAVRAHKDVGRTVERAADAVALIVMEMISNKILNSATHDKLSNEVVDPLRSVVDNEVQNAISSAASAKKNDGERSLRDQAADDAEALEDALATIVARMGRIEDLAEIIARLKDIIKRERELMDETKRKAGGGGN